MNLMDALIKNKYSSANESVVSAADLHEEERKAKAELSAKINYVNKNRIDGRENKKIGEVAAIKVREVSNGADKYLVRDALYSYHYDGSTSVWQYGIRYENKDADVREFLTEIDGKEVGLVLRKEKGTYQEYGDSSDSGDFSDCSAMYSKPKDDTKSWQPDYFSIPEDLDLADTNAIRYHFRKNGAASYFLDKFVIVTPEERRAYLNFVETRSDYDKDELKHAKERCLDSKLAILRNKIAKGIDADLATKFEEVELAKPLKKIEKFISDKLFGKVNE